jgi:hypothetical protein
MCATGVIVGLLAVNSAADSSDRLKSAEAELQDLLHTRTDKHPDVLLKRKEVEALQQRIVAGASQKQRKSADLAALKEQLATLLLTHTPKHPDVISLQTKIANLDVKAAEKVGRSSEVDASVPFVMPGGGK